MLIKVKLFATLRANREKEMLLELAQGSVPKDIIELLNIPEHETAIIFVNGRGAKLDNVLEDNDTVSLFPPVGGG